MQNPFQQNNAGSMGGMNDPLGFVKKLWGDMQLPGMVTPTLSVDELDKQIKDLKTVESWLTVNMNMLKGTIQALEVQRATIAALKTMGESFAQATGNSEKATTSTFSSQWPMPETGSSNKTQPKQKVPEPAVEDEMDEDDEEPEVDELPQAEVPAAAKEEQGAQTSTAKSDGGAFSNPAAWWTVLQDQFKQALSHAMQDEVSTKTASVDQGSVKNVKEGKSAVSKEKSGSAKVAVRKVPMAAKTPKKNPSSTSSTTAKRSEKTSVASKAPLKRRVTSKSKLG